MKVVIVGSGLIGVATAYFFRRRAHEVLVLDRQSGAGQETSFANGGLLTPSMAEPWNAPGCWRELARSIGRSDSALKLRVSAIPRLAGWGAEFLRNSNPRLFAQHRLNNLRLGLLSLRVLGTIRQQTQIEYARQACGTLRLFRDSGTLDRVGDMAIELQEEGLHSRRLSVEETLRLEPSLTPLSDKLAGAIHYEDDEVGDAHRFCLSLAEHAARHGVKFRFGVEVRSFDAARGRVSALTTTQGKLAADLYVIAAGSYSTPLLRSAGISLPVAPAKGYSVTYTDVGGGPHTLRVPIVDDDRHAVVARIGRCIRAAGTAEFAGYDRTINPARVRNLTTLVRELLPRAGLEPSTAKAWCGLRPMSADGVPIIGFTTLRNLMINTGHGHLGWTLSAGSGQLLAELACGETPSIDPVPYAPSRFT